MSRCLTKSMVLILVIISGMCSCKSNEVNKNIESHSKPVIGLMMDGLVIERWQKDRDIFISKAKELGAEVIVQNANEDIKVQVNQIYSMIEKKIDVLVIIPYDKDGLAQCVKEAKKKDIPVISYDRLILNGGVDAYVSFDNEKVGSLMAEALYKKVPYGGYIIVNGSMKDNNSYMFNSGFKKSLQEGIDNKHINIVSEVWSEDWRENAAYNAVSKAIEERRNFHGVIGGNDRLAEGAIKALSENRMANNVYVVGHDADLSACQRIVEGNQLATVYKPIEVLAEGGAALAVDLAKGKKIDVKDTIFDGKYEVPFLKFDPILVTKDNMVETVIKDGFHTFEEVYRNVPSLERPSIVP